MNYNMSFLEEICYEKSNSRLSAKAKLQKEMIRLNSKLYIDNILIKVIEKDDDIMLLIYKQKRIKEVLKVKFKLDEYISVENTDKILIDNIWVYKLKEWLNEYIKNIG